MGNPREVPYPRINYPRTHRPAHKRTRMQDTTNTHAHSRPFARATRECAHVAHAHAHAHESFSCADKEAYPRKDSRKLVGLIPSELDLFKAHPVCTVPGEAHMDQSSRSKWQKPKTRRPKGLTSKIQPKIGLSSPTHEDPRGLIPVSVFKDQEESQGSAKPGLIPKPPWPRKPKEEKNQLHEEAYPP